MKLHSAYNQLRQLPAFRTSISTNFKNRITFNTLYLYNVNLTQQLGFLIQNNCLYLEYWTVSMKQYAESRKGTI